MPVHVADRVRAEDLVIKPSKKKSNNETSISKNYIVALVIVVIIAGLWQAKERGLIDVLKKQKNQSSQSASLEPTVQRVTDSKEIETAIDPKEVKTVTLMLLPRYLRLDKPSMLNIKKGSDLKELAEKIEKEVSTKTLAVKVFVDSEYAYTKNDFSDMKNSFVAASLSPLLRIKLRNAPIEPMATFSPSFASTCFRDAAVVVKTDSTIKTIADLKDKKMMVEGIAEGPSILFNKFTDEVNTAAKGIYSNIAFQMEPRPLIESLQNGSSDALFLNMYTVPGEGHFTIFGKLGDNNKIAGYDEFKVLQLAQYDLPCGLLMATSDVPQETRDELFKSLNKFLDEGNRDFVSKQIGIKSFFPTPVETWTKSVDFMHKFTVESPAGQVVMEKIKRSVQ